MFMIDDNDFVSLSTIRLLLRRWDISWVDLVYSHNTCWYCLTYYSSLVGLNGQTDRRTGQLVNMHFFLVFQKCHFHFFSFNNDNHLLNLWYRWTCTCSWWLRFALLALTPGTVGTLLLFVALKFIVKYINKSREVSESEREKKGKKWVIAYIYIYK